MDRAIAARNRAAVATLAEKRPTFRVAHDRLHATDPDIEKALTIEAINLHQHQAATAGDKYIPISGAGRERWLAVSLSYFKPESTMQVFGALDRLLLTLHPRNANAVIDPAILQAALSLTRSEAKVGALIYAGKSIPDAAAELGVAETTVKTHFLSICNKTGVSKQTGLVRLIADLVA